MSKLGTPELDRLFCLYAKKYGLRKLVLKAVAIIESSLNDKAFRFEPKFWERYMRGKPEWDKWKGEINRASASYGLMQLMYPTAVMLGFKGEPEDLYDPVINIALGAKLLNQLISKVNPLKTYLLTPLNVSLAKYNGGAVGNPNENQELRNQKYVNKVLKEYEKLKETEKECNETD